ncbi:hypothetical protein FJQ54_01085 [Sandaracinobacter neustonicus]|uniref:Uncharacterized protein n=1 Tax=Sandaracinobacter neustonicus TaxID=1715348 RepID=A0A501XWA9_9SPHN|nr:hypothetical protein [Sandaracinobacter neustonicus]TPE64623.1 hypothetical protein FJQ54_01085 [Sandaracinobacter neustonicus]
MNEATDNQKDERVAHALSKLPEPPLPDGMAARITARATATAQLAAADVGAAPKLLVAAPGAVDPASVTRGRRADSWRSYAAASAAAVVLLSIGLVSISLLMARPGQDSGATPSVTLAGTPALPAAEPAAAPVRLANAPAQQMRPSFPAESANAKPARAPIDLKAADLKANGPSAVPQSPAALPEVRLAQDEAPAVSPVDPLASENKLAQFGPPAPRQDSKLPAEAYGPPAPTALAAAGGSAAPPATSVEAPAAAIASHSGSPPVPARPQPPAAQGPRPRF